MDSSEQPDEGEDGTISYDENNVQHEDAHNGDPRTDVISPGEDSQTADPQDAGGDDNSAGDPFLGDGASDGDETDDSPDCNSGPVHPQVFFGPNDLAELRANVSSSLGTPMWTSNKEVLDRHIADPLPTEPIDRFAARYAPRAAMAYLITGDSKYAQFAKTLLLYFANNIADWNGSYGNGGTSYIVSDISIAYDWLYAWSGWTDPERAQVRNRIIAEVPNIIPDCDMRHRSFSAMMIAGYALMCETPEASDWIATARAWAVNYMSSTGYGSDGFWTSGPSYGEGQASDMGTMFAAAKYHGDRFWDTQWSRNQAKYWPYVGVYASRTYDQFRYADNFDAATIANEDNINNIMYFIGKSGRPMLIFAYLYRDIDENVSEVLEYFARQQMSVLDTLRQGFRQDWDPQVFWMIDSDATVVDPTQLPLSQYFPDFEAVIAKNGFSETDTQFYMRSGPNNGHVGFVNSQHTPSYEGHANPDANAFMIFSRGEWLGAMSDYTNPRYTKTFSTQLVDGSGQMGDGWGWGYAPTPSSHPEMNKLRLRHVIDTGKYFTVLGDAANAYSEKTTVFDRSVVFIRPDLFVIADDIASNLPRRYDWMLQLDFDKTQSQLDSQRFRVLGKNNAAMTVTFVKPPAPVFESGTHVVTRESTMAPYLSFHPSLNSTSAQFLVVLEAHDKTATDRSVAKLTATDGEAFQIGTSDFCAAKAFDTSSVSVGAFSVHGKIACWKGTDTTATAFASLGVTRVVLGSYSVSSTQPMALSLDGLDGEVSTEIDGELTVAYPGLSSIVLDGQPVIPLDFSSGQIRFALKGGRHRIQLVAP